MREIDLVFAGSGTNYPAYVGAYRAFYEEYVLTKKAKIGRIYGTSGGALVGSLIAFGYDTPEALENVVKTIQPASIVDWSWNPFYRLGLVKGAKMRKALHKLFSQHDNFPKPKHRLFVAVTDIDSGGGRVIEVGSNNLSPSSVVYASACFPLVFSPVMIDKKKHVDGGLYNNFMIDEVEHGREFIGFHIGNLIEDVGGKKVNTLLTYILRMISVMLNELTKERAQNLLTESPRNAQRMIMLSGLKNSMNLKLTSEEIGQLFETNYRIAKNAIRLLEK